MMTIRGAKFVLSLDRLRAFPGQGMPEIAMAGKSNVGKSSMINSLLGNSKLARTSSEPGKTRLINFFQVNEQFWLVDLPGYGLSLIHILRAHQRTLMLSREEYGAQLVDVFDLSAPRALRYAFHSPFAPEFFGGGVRLGPMLLSWEGKPVADARRLEASASFPEGQWEIALTYPEAGPRAMFTFFMRHA